MKKILIVLIVLACVCAGVLFIVMEGLDVVNYRKQFLDYIQELMFNVVTLQFQFLVT